MVPGVAMIETAISLSGQDVERAQRRAEVHKARGDFLRLMLEDTNTELQQDRKQSEDAKKQQENHQQERDRWEQRKIAMGKELTRVRNVKVGMNTTISDCHLTLENKVIDAQAWLDYYDTRPTFVRRKVNLLKKLDETARELREMAGSLKKLDETPRELLEMTGVSVLQEEEVRGFNVAKVSITAGDFFVNVGGKSWKQVNKDYKERFDFVEIEPERDEWSVYLIDHSRDMVIRTDLYMRKVLWCNQKGVNDYGNRDCVIAFIQNAFLRA